MSDKITPYFEARVLLAAVVLSEYRNNRAADIKDIASLSTFSVEKIHHLVKKLEDLGALRRITGPFDDKVVIEDESAVEQLKDLEHSANIEDEVAQFAAKQKEKFTDINSLFGGGKSAEKKDLQAELEQKLKSGGGGRKENPLDALSKPKKDS